MTPERDRARLARDPAAVSPCERRRPHRRRPVLPRRPQRADGRA
jgi:hypothetical protein